MMIVLTISAQETFTPIKDFCQPGVKHKSPGKGAMIEYGYFPGYGQRSSNKESTTVQGNHHLLVKFKVPIINREKFKVLFGARYFEEVYIMDDPDQQDSWLFHNLDGKKLKSHRFSAYVSRSIGHQHYVGMKAELSYNGDYDSFLTVDNRYRESFLVGVVGRKPTAYKEWGLGVITRFGYRGMAAFPFLIYNQTFNERWGIEATLPVKCMIRYRMNPASLILFGGEFASRNYGVDLEKGNESSPLGRYVINNPEGQLNIAFQQKLSKWIWMEMKTGYIRYLKANVNGEQTVADIDFRVYKRDSGFFKVGLFLSPPKSFMQKRR
ncbi:MAG: hypothetical protein AB8F74_01560 [Saprospiraceae bacterium]